jgi:peptidoglycan/LPS O-acetylase OafA/YrhL
MLFYWPVLVLFPLTILALALLEARRGPLLKPLSFLGDISYSAYLLHFPLQLLLYVIVAKFARGSAIYYSPWTMLAYFGVLVGIGMTCYRCFEMPVQARLRRACLA